ncbi:MAG: hypothetical protein KME03_19425 [Aphanocapsa lilacina HA4352-LM1]|jgi:hypothetical protein|nr:hypothetical protein [Aphanocapsa lilacina HA4352-LM1]
MDKPTLRIPDPATRGRLVENLRQASVELRAFGQEIQALTDEMDRQFNESPIGRFHARRKAATRNDGQEPES